jgi:hypothetical protein
MRPLSTSNDRINTPTDALALQVFFKGSRNNVLISESAIPELNEQEIFARLCFNRLYVGKSVTDSLGDFYYKHQHLTSRLMFMNDSLFVMHDPGTGKTITYLYSMMKLLASGAITKFVIINYSTSGNKVAEKTLRVIYEREFAQYFSKTFQHFWKEYVETTTLHKIGSHNYDSFTGIIIDEAHNMLSDNESGANKVVNVGEFIQKLSLLRGIKLMLLTATPLQGEVSSLGKFRSILFRSSTETRQSIPPSFISYTQINYPHLEIKEMLNQSSPETIRSGDKSFELSNGVIYPLYLYSQKPSYMQIADFASLATSTKKAPFQSNEKPLIVSSVPRKRMIEGPDGQMIETKVAQSAIVQNIIHLVDKTKDGTIVVYCDLVEDGAKAVARYLDQNGWEKYSSRDPGSTQTQDKQIRKHFNPLIKELETELANNLAEIQERVSELTDTSDEELASFHEQLETFQGYQDVKEAFKTYIENYEEEHKRNISNQEEIGILDTQCRKIRGEIKRYKSFGVSQRTQSNRRYMIYSSSMSSQDNEAFRLFNSESNWDGKHIKMIIGSRVMRDGVDIFHAVQTHIIIPEWRIAGFIQAQHRGIRSSGHKYLIHHRAIRMVEEEKSNVDIAIEDKITYKEAHKKIVENKITIEIYNHFVDMELLEIEDITNAREFINENPDLRNLSDFDILALLKGPNAKHKAGEAIINAAIEKHRNVGAEVMHLRSQAIDYKLNVGRQSRIKNAISEREKTDQEHIYTDTELLATKDTELFFSKDYTEIIINIITDILLEKSYEHTDNIFETLMETRRPELIPPEEISGISHSRVDETFIYPNKHMIATSIIELVRYRKRVYNEKFGIWMYVKLYETKEESILYLSVTNNPMNIHPFIAISETIGYSANTQLKRKSTKVTDADLALPKNAKILYKLRDLIERAVNKVGLSQIELTFLIQMSNYWAFSWKDLTSSRNLENISVYLLVDHITRPSMNNLAKDLSIIEYRSTTKEWHTTTNVSLKNILLVRYATLVELYRKFNFLKLPEFGANLSNTYIDTQQDTNGIIFIKGYYNPREDTEDWKDKLLTGEDVVRIPSGENVVVKRFLSSTSKGRQIIDIMPGKNGGREEVISMIKTIIDSEVSLLFFLYNRDTTTRGMPLTIYDIKKEELNIMLQAINGKPTLRFQILEIEKQFKNPLQKQEIYKQIYKLPSFITQQT